MGKSVAIIGAGLTGLMAAIHLAQRGFEVVVYERRSLFEIAERPYTSSGNTSRSMSIDISARGIFALKNAGVFDDVLVEAIPMTQRIFHEFDGEIFALPYSQNENETILSVSRLHIFKTLLVKCREYSNIAVFFEHSANGIDFIKRSVSIVDNISQKQKLIFPAIVIATDGINSILRESFDNNNFEISTFPMSYKELTISAAHAHGFASNATHKWPRKDAMLVAQPNKDGSFMCALLLAENGGERSFTALDNGEAIRKLFDELFHDASTRMPNLEDEYLRNPVGRMKIVKAKRWSKNNFVLLLGDAAHGMVPFFGQGVNCCFEDCSFLAECIDRFNDWSEIFAEIDRVRVPCANAINTMSYENYPELFSYENYPAIQHQRKIEATLMKRFHSFRTYHNLVCFERVPYTFAQRVKAVQDQLLYRLSTADKIKTDLIDREYQCYQQQIGQIKADEQI